jgi:hypothetical protein
MEQLDKKERLKNKQMEPGKKEGQSLKIVTKPLKDTQNEGSQKISLSNKEIQQKLKLIEKARQKVAAAPPEDSKRQKASEANKQKASPIEEKVKERVSIAIAGAKQLAQKVFKAREKKREGDKNKGMANFAVEEAQRSEKYQGKEVGQKAALADKTKESTKTGMLFNKSASDDRPIPPEDKDLICGQLTLLIDPGAPKIKILRLISLLSYYPEIKIVSIGNITDIDPRVELFVQNPQPIYQVLYSLPFVQQIVGKEKELRIKIRPDERLRGQ